MFWLAPDPREFLKNSISAMSEIIENPLNCKLGVYRIYWTSGGYSVASIGQDYHGDRWIAPSNWTCEKGRNPTALMKDYIEEIERIELIDVQHKDY